MTTGATCTVYADGVRLADGGPGDDPADPTALSGLSITWGRDTTVDQPDPATCTFAIMDTPGGLAFSDRLHTGSEVAVTTTALAYPEPSTPVWPDPGFESGVNAVPASARVSRTGHRVLSGAWAVGLTPTVATRQAAVILAPLPFAAPGTNPGAWDAIPATAPGQRWGFGLSA